MDIELKQTCYACPEQYEAFLNGQQVGYLRLRGGYFKVECPDVGDQLVYEANPSGDGIFDNDERHYYLDAAKKAIYQWLARTPPAICRGCKHLSSDNLTEYHPPSYYCQRHLMWPTKGTCKKREEYV
jgi:hypothetical protein